MTLTRATGKYSSRRFFIQGQNGIRKNEREYFYHLNHQGQLFLHDTRIKNFTTCFKDPVFLNFFYERIRPVREKEARHAGFNWISPCGFETNFIQVDLLPLVFDKIEKNHLIDSSNTFRQKFDPSSLFMNESGVLFHTGAEKLGGVGVIKSPGLAELIFEKLVYEDDQIVAYDSIPLQNSKLRENLDLLVQHNLAGNTLN